MAQFACLLFSSNQIGGESQCYIAKNMILLTAYLGYTKVVYSLWAELPEYKFSKELQNKTFTGVNREQFDDQNLAFLTEFDVPYDIDYRSSSYTNLG